MFVEILDLPMPEDAPRIRTRSLKGGISASRLGCLRRRYRVNKKGPSGSARKRNKNEMDSCAMGNSCSHGRRKPTTCVSSDHVKISMH